VEKEDDQLLLTTSAIKSSQSVELKRAVMFVIVYLLLGVTERFPCPAEEKAILPVYIVGMELSCIPDGTVM
jgi:hypothetical protein